MSINIHQLLVDDPTIKKDIYEYICSDCVQFNDNQCNDCPILKKRKISAMKRIPLTVEQCNKIYDVLVEIGADETEHMRQDFVYQYTSDDPPSEWRFMGMLGFGGKLWYRPYGKQIFNVNCYRENETDKIRKIIDQTNLKLKSLSDEMVLIQNEFRDKLRNERL